MAKKRSHKNAPPPAGDAEVVSTGGRSGKRVWILNSLLVLVATVVGLVIAEAIARKLVGNQSPPDERKRRFFYSEPMADRDRVYRILPDSEFVTFGVQYRTNELGFRDGPIQKKGEDLFRILCLGDSVTFGTGMSNEDTFPNQLERSLAQLASGTTTYDVINAGVSAYNARNIRAQFEAHAEELRPDVVVYTFVENDLDDSFSVGPGRFLIPYDPKIAEDDSFYQDDYPATWMLQKLSKKQYGSSLMKILEMNFKVPSGAAPALLIGDHPTPRSRWNRFESDLVRMKEIAEGLGARFALYEFALRHHSEPVSRRVRDLCEKLGVPYASTRPIFSKDNYQSEYSLGFDPHCNIEGNRLMADRLRCFLVSTGLLPEDLGDGCGYEESLDTLLADKIEAPRHHPPSRIDFLTGEGIEFGLGGVDYAARMARSCRFRLGGEGKKLAVQARAIITAPGEGHGLAARIEEASATEFQRVSSNGSVLEFEIPEVFAGRPIEVELTCEGPAYIPTPQERLQGESPYTVMIEEVSRRN